MQGDGCPRFTARTQVLPRHAEQRLQNKPLMTIHRSLLRTRIVQDVAAVSRGYTEIQPRSQKKLLRSTGICL